MINNEGDPLVYRWRLSGSSLCKNLDMVSGLDIYLRGYLLPLLRKRPVPRPVTDAAMRPVLEHSITGRGTRATGNLWQRLVEANSYSDQMDHWMDRWMGWIVIRGLFHDEDVPVGIPIGGAPVNSFRIN